VATTELLTNDISLWVLRGLGGFLIAATLVPMVRTGHWAVRVFDFPRIQFGVASLFVVAGYALHGGLAAWTSEHLVMIGALLVAAMWQGSYAYRYARIAPSPLPWADTSSLSVFIANLDFRNEQKSAAVETLRDIEADVLLLIEIDDDWRRELASLRESYEHVVENIRPRGRGIALWSKVEITASEIRHVVSEDRPSVHATLRLEDGRTMRFVGIHPTPPALPDGNSEKARYDSWIRDAELVRVGREAGENVETPWIIAGDFNDVVWSRVTRMFENLSGLTDPRVGRGVFGTYHARYPLFRYPLDHAFVSKCFEVADLKRVRVPGSDHFGFSIALLLDGSEPAPQHSPSSSDGEEQYADEIEETGEQAVDDRRS
jgi:endonuclease/exonuclease/phosphatase (EEP) superfamily protein YafD